MAAEPKMWAAIVREMQNSSQPPSGEDAYSTPSVVLLDRHASSCQRVMPVM